MAIAGHTTTVTVSSNDTTYNAVDGIKSVEFSPSVAMLETTDFADTSGARTKIAGLKDGTLTISGDYEESDTGAALVRTQWASGGALWLKFAPNGTTGFKVLTIVSDYKVSSSFDGLVQFSATLQFNGTIATF